MATLSLPKNYADGTTLFESDLDDFKDGMETFLNTTKVNDDNVQTGGITASTKLVDASINAAKMGTDSVETAKIKDSAVTEAKMALINKTMPIGSITMFHTFNGTVSIPRGWMKCNGDVVNSTNYDAIHAAGNFTTDAVGSAALNALNLPNLEAKYPVGAASTTQDGSVAITAVGNASNQVDISHVHTGASHNHKWYENNGAAIDDKTYDTNGSEVNPQVGSTKSGAYWHLAAPTQAASISLFDAWTSDAGAANTGSAGSATQSIQPASIEVIYIMKVV